MFAANNMNPDEEIVLGQYLITQDSAPGTFTLTNRVKNTTESIRMVEKPGIGVIFEGLPSFFDHFINQFSHEQRRESPIYVLDSAIRTYEQLRAKPGALLETLAPSNAAEATTWVFESA